MWPLTVAGILARMLSRAKTRIVVSDHTTLSKPYAGHGWWHGEFLKWSVRIFYPRAEARIVVSRQAAEDLSRLSGLPVSAFEVVYNPVDPPGEGTGNADAERLWGGAGKRILNVGRLDREKNQKLLIDAFARLSVDHDARLMILGEGSLREELERTAAELGIADRVVMPGFILDPGPIYRSADLFVLSSDHEGYPLVLIEAMHCGLAIVSMDCLSGPAEILNQGEFGTLTPCGDSERLAAAIAEALETPSDPDRLKARAAQLSASAADRYWELLTR
jgi:glycosyltransferase involved in cell wall biosynthesis